MKNNGITLIALVITIEYFTIRIKNTVIQWVLAYDLYILIRKASLCAGCFATARIKEAQPFYFVIIELLLKKIIILFFQSKIRKEEFLKIKNKELKQTIIDERTGIEYNLVNGYYIPNIVMPKPRRTGNVGKYGRMKAKYLKEHKKAEYSIKLVENELTSHLLDKEKV